MNIIMKHEVLFRIQSRCQHSTLAFQDAWELHQLILQGTFLFSFFTNESTFIKAKNSFEDWD